MRRREAQARCPGLEVLAGDAAAEARLWEPAVAAVETFAPGAEVLQPGQLALGAWGASRYFGGDQVLAAKVAASIEAVVACQAGDGWAGGGSDGRGGGDGRAGGSGGWAGGSGGWAGGGGGWAGCCRVGIADGLFAAGLAARQASAGEPLVVPKGRSAEFLAPLSVKLLALSGLGSPAGVPGSGDVEGLVDLLERLGLKTLGDFAALPAPSVLGRFGAEGLLAHRLARGLGERSVRARLPPPDWVVSAELDPPADQLYAAAFVGKALDEELHDRLSGTGLVCTRLAIEVETEYGTTLRRSWRHDGALSAAAIGERVRWQLEGWARAGQPGRPGAELGPEAAEINTAGRIIKLTLVPEEVCPDEGRQLGFWGNDAAAETRAARALARVQGLLGPQAALTGVLQGGRDYTEQVRLVPWGEPRVPSRPGGPNPAPASGGSLGWGPQAGKQATAQGGVGAPASGRSLGWGTQAGKEAAAQGGVGPQAGKEAAARRRSARRSQLGRTKGAKTARGEAPPWPGQLPGLAPAVVHHPPLPAQVTDGSGEPVSVGSRGAASGRPARLVIGNGKPMAINAWAGPWPLEERWWDAGGRRRARFQVCTVGGTAYLLAREGRRWWVEATYD
jgi:protein ImuB